MEKKQLEQWYTQPQKSPPLVHLLLGEMLKVVLKITYLQKGLDVWLTI